MNASNRRQFLADVGKGMLVASVGAALAGELGISPAWADAEAKGLSFGPLEALAAQMQETPPDKLMPVLVQRLENGTDLKTLVAAGALANAREFGGNDYIGFHTFMALGPAYQMSLEMPAAQKALPVLKVLYRNASRIQAVGGRPKEMLHPVEPLELPAGNGGEIMQEATRSSDNDRAERTFAALAKGPAGEAFNHLQYSVQDEVDVHRVVLAWRAFSTLDLTGAEHAHSLLRQSVRYCVQREQEVKKNNRPAPGVRAVLPKLLDQYKLLSRSAGDKRAEDGWIDRMATQIAGASRDQAADMVAAALAEGFIIEDVAEAICLAANLLVLRDPGRPQEWSSAEKPPGSTHGDSVGVHASDSANAWRNIARVSNPRNQMASMIVAAYHTAGQFDRLNKEPYPFAEHTEKVTAKEADALLADLEAAVKEKDQLRACAVVQKYGSLGHPARPAFDVLLKFGVSEDGALHAEKYYRTVSEEFTASRTPFRWRQLAALARVTASEFGRPAPGYQQSRELLKV